MKKTPEQLLCMRIDRLVEEAQSANPIAGTGFSRFLQHVDNPNESLYTRIQREVLENG